MKKQLISAFGILTCLSLPAIADDDPLPPTATEQKELTPKEVLKDLLDGNARFVAGDVNLPNIGERIEATATGQFPKAYILSCVDSRVPVELVFDEGIGDIFVGRVAGNIESVQQLGSMEFATKAAGSKLVMVLGHEACGAVKGACDHVKLGNLTALLAEIQPAVAEVDGFKDDQKNSKNKDFVAAVVKKNVINTVNDIRSRSSVLSELEKSGDIMIVGALYSLQTGKVTVIDSTLAK